MAVDEGSKQAPINVARDSSVVGSRFEGTYCFIAIPVAFDLQTLLVQSPATITMAEMVRIIILKCFLFHPTFLCFNSYTDSMDLTDFTSILSVFSLKTCLRGRVILDGVILDGVILDGVILDGRSIFFRIIIPMI
jgi:hypothetical protein